MDADTSRRPVTGEFEISYEADLRFVGFDDEKVATRFVQDVRNGILHDAETRGWTIWREDPPNRIVATQGNRFILNRTALHLAVRNEFEQYVADLFDPTNEDLRRRFVDKMNKIAARS